MNKRQEKTFNPDLLGGAGVEGISTTSVEEGYNSIIAQVTDDEVMKCVYALMGHRGLTRDQALDVVADVLATGKYDPAKGRLSTYVFAWRRSIAAARTCEQAKTSEEGEEDEEGENNKNDEIRYDDDFCGRVAAMEILGPALRALGTECRAILYARFVLGLTIAEIAHKTGQSVGKTHECIGEAITAMRAFLEARGVR